jgi:hypothetical protein
VPPLDEDYLILSTIHSAEGQEWKSVFVLNVVDGCMPSDLATGTTAEIEEERRLLYVAMTRAKDTLHLITPHRFFTHGQSSMGDRHVYASRSRFTPGSLLSLFESLTWPILATEVARQAAISQVRIDVGARMRGMWRRGEALVCWCGHRVIAIETQVIHYDAIRALSSGRSHHGRLFGSRFIPGSLLSLFESLTWPILATEVARQAAISQVRVDVGARMRHMWR